VYPNYFIWSMPIGEKSKIGIFPHPPAQKRLCLSLTLSFWGGWIDGLRGVSTPVGWVWVGRRTPENRGEKGRIITLSGGRGKESFRGFAYEGGFGWEEKPS